MEERFLEAPELKELARSIIAVRREVSFVDVDDILFLKEMDTKPRASARTYSFADHPVKYFTDQPFCIVFYEANIDYMTGNQRKMVMFHELMHIPPTGYKLIDHTIKDFANLLKIGYDWSSYGKEVPDILEKDAVQDHYET